MADCHMAGLASGKLSYGTLVKKQIVIWHFRLWQSAHGKLHDGELTLAKDQNSRFFTQDYTKTHKKCYLACFLRRGAVLYNSGAAFKPIR